MIPDRLHAPDLTLRPFAADDADAVFAYWQSDSGWARYNASVPADFSLTDARSFVEQMRARDRREGPNWAIVHQGSVVGVVSLVFEQDKRIAIVGYGIHGDLRGRGLTVEAVTTVIDEAFRHVAQLRRIRAHTDARNLASMRVLEKLGFAREGLLRKNQFVDNRFVDEAIYGLLREDWGGRGTTSRTG